VPRHKIKLAGLILLLSFAGCIKEKNELTLPVTISSKISFSVDSSKCGEYVDITGGRIGIGMITFRGIRENGEDYSFTTNPKFDFPTPSSVWFLEKGSIISNFNFPQGTYTDMEWEMEMWAVPNSDLVNLIKGLTIEDLAATGVIEGFYDGSWIWISGPAIAIAGTYKSLDGSVIPFLLAGDFILYDDGEDFNCILRAQSFDPDGNSRIVISADKEYESNMIFTLEIDFRSINRELFEEAKTSGSIGNPVIIISNHNNKDLYKVLTSGNSLSIKVIIREKGSAIS
jgi:hypothetical protein